MDSRKRGNPLFPFHCRNKQDGGNDGRSEVQVGVEDTFDLFGEEDDELFSMISEDSIKIEEEPEQKQPQPSTSYQVGRPSGQAAPSRPIEKLPEFDEVSGATWIYPLNYPVRGYQYSMVENSLFRNTLISLPTGLGKTFIAAVVMYNFYRWYPTCKVVFMAPTKPLVAQQVEACFNIMGIPQEDISQMTGTLNPEKRTEQWEEKRIFFLTPQVLTNDLSRGTCPATLIKCLVLDEAHRALGNHAYCQVVRGLKEHEHDFRILALSATPGSDIVAVQQVLMNLFISHVELRNEDSPDIQEFTFQRTIEKMVIPLGEELTSLKDRYIKVLRVYVNRLLELKVLYTRDESTLTKFQILKSRECFRQNPPDNLPRSRFGVVEGLFALCMTLYHSYELMLQHGIRSFYRFLKETLSNEKSHFFARGELRNNGLFQSIMKELSEKFDADSCAPQSSEQGHSTLFSLVGSQVPKVTPKAPFIISHPKMEKLLSIVLEHHQKYANEGNSTRIMIFSQYRDSVMEITEMLQQHHPTVKAMSFIGHNTAGPSGGKGLSQKKQLQVVSKFREGGYNTLVSTCVGEEGLDIGDVDLIICYDAPKSPIRLVQRMGRTGRKREGRIVVLVTKGKEEQSYNSSQYQKKAINNALANTSRLTRYLNPNSPRMVPNGLSPTCLKLHMKVDVWKTNAKGCKMSPNGRGSILSMISKAGSTSSKSKSGAAVMSPDEWQLYRRMRVPQKEIRTLPLPSLICMDGSKSEFDPERHINLGSYQPWQSLAQTTHLVGHSPHTLNLVEITEFIHLQQHIGPDEDPYGLEMAAFLDKTYLEDNESYHLSPDFKKAHKKPPPVHSEEDGGEKNRKRKQNTISKKKKKPKNFQSSLITDMFNRMTQSQTRERQDNHQQKMDIHRKQSIAGSQDGLKEDFESCDDDVICLTDDVAVVTKILGTVDEPQTDRPSQYMEAPETSKKNTNHKKMEGERLDINKDELFLPVPTGSLLSIDIVMPPKISENDYKELVEPDSPSEVLEFCDEWITRNLKKMSKVVQKVHVSSHHSKDMFEQSVIEEVYSIKKTNVNKCMTESKKQLDDDGQHEETSVSLFSVGEASPILGKTQLAKNNAIRNADNDEKINSTPKGAGDLLDLCDDAVSPIVGRNSTFPCSSTPKVVSKCLLKKFSLGLSTVEESPIPRKDASPATSVMNVSKCQKGSIRAPDLLTSHRNRFKSKLSKFAKPKVLEIESVGEISPGDKGKVDDILLAKGSSNNLKKKLQYKEEETSHSGKAEMKKDRWGKIDKEKSFDLLHNESPECHITNLRKNSDKCTSGKEKQQSTFCDNHKNVSNITRTSPQLFSKPKDVNEVESINGTRVTHAERNQMCKDAQSKSATKGNKQPNVPAGSSNTSHDTMEDCSLFEHIEEYEIDPTETSLREKHPDSSVGVSITQVLNFMHEKSSHSTQHVSINTPIKSSQIHSGNFQKENMQPSGHPSAKCDSSLGRNTQCVSLVNKSDKCVETPVHERSRLSRSKTLPKFSKSNRTIELNKTQEYLKEKHVSSCNQENDETDEMSESLLADSDFKHIEIPDAVDDVQNNNESNLSSCFSLCAKEEDPVNRIHEESKNQSSKSSVSCKNQNDSSKLLSPTQNETQLFIMRKRKAYNVVESDYEDSLISSDSGKDISKTTTESSRTSSVNACVTEPLRKAVADRMNSNPFEGDDDDDFIEVLGPPKPQEQKPKKVRKKKKRKRLDYLDEEAEVTKDGVCISSDESEKDEENEYDCSFVDDGTYLTQDNEVDMRAVYLKSVVSPMKGRSGLTLPPPPKYRHDSDDSEDEEEDEDSFVVDNSFVEYETEYVGDTMLAEDPIIHQALQDQGKSKRTKTAAAGNKAKRKRIILDESSSEEGTPTSDSKRLDSPVKVHSSSGIGKIQRSREDAGSQTRKDAMNCQSIPGCSTDKADGEKDFEIIKEVHSSRSPRVFLKHSDDMLLINNGSEQYSQNSSVKPKVSNSQQTNSVSIVNAMNDGCAANDQQVSQKLGSSRENQFGDNLIKNRGGNVLDERLNTLSDTGTSARPTFKSVSGCQSALSQSSQVNKSSSSFFVASVPFNTSLTESQSTTNTTSQDVGVLVDSSEVSSGGNVLSRLRLHYGAQTAVVPLEHAHYAVSTRMAVLRLSLAVFSSGQHRSRLVERVQALLELYERPVLIVEGEAAKGSPPNNQACGRSRYLDTIVCACTQVASLKVLYSKGQDETSFLLWQLLLQEKNKGFKISSVPVMNKKRKQMTEFYRTLPSISFPTALTLSQNFISIKEFINSSAECIQRRGKISLQRATTLKQHLNRRFREDMLP